MKLNHLHFAALCIFTLAVSASAQSNTSVDDGHGREWMQLTDSTALSWTQIAQVCPQDGATACTAAVGGRDLTGWIWGTQAQVRELLGYYEPAMLTNPGVSGQQYFFSASTFLGAFRPTFSVFLTYQSSSFAAGWTASTDLSGQPIVGSVSMGTTPVSIGGSFGLGPVANAAEIRSDRGAFLWRSTGLSTNAVIANDDAGQVPSPAGGVTVPNVRANDWIVGVRATAANSILSVESTTNAGVTLDLANGSVRVAAGTAAGSHTLIYKLCALANSTNCDGAAVRVTVPPYVVKAVNDQGSASPSSGGTAVANILANDTLGAAPATLANVFVTQLSSTSPGVALNQSTASVLVTRGTPVGVYTLLYKVCELANPANCDVATATITVQPYVIDDSARASSKTGGLAIANVLANDRLGAMPATTSNVKITLLTPPIPGITFVITTGAVTVAPKTNSGLYTMTYRICEVASASNCDQATVTLDLSGK
jgi:hypothetical protein